AIIRSGKELGQTVGSAFWLQTEKSKGLGLKGVGFQQLTEPDVSETTWWVFRTRVARCANKLPKLGRGSPLSVWWVSFFVWAAADGRAGLTGSRSCRSSASSSSAYSTGAKACRICHST